MFHVLRSSLYEMELEVGSCAMVLRQFNYVGYVTSDRSGIFEACNVDSFLYHYYSNLSFCSMRIPIQLVDRFSGMTPPNSGTPKPEIRSRDLEQ